MNTKVMRRGIVIVLGMFVVPGMSLASEGNIDSTDKYAWGENNGWYNYRPTHGGATVADGGVSGYIWQENVGWIKLAYGGIPPYGNTSSTDWGVNNDGNGNLSGFGWSEKTGWVNFNPTHSQVVIDAYGNFSGYAWAEGVGWIHFASMSPVAYKVKTDWTSGPTPTPTETPTETPTPTPTRTPTFTPTPTMTPTMTPTVTPTPMPDHILN
ncbi:MAG: hypothetical protein P8123_08040, partial [bacterium]